MNFFKTKINFSENIISNQIQLKILSILTVIIILINPLSAQTLDKNYIDGEVYVKIKDDYRSDFDFQSDSPDFDLRNTPFLDGVKRNYNFDVKSSFYFSKSEKLRRTLRISIDEFRKIDDLIRELNSLKELEYVEKIPLNRTFLTPDDLGQNSTNGQWGLHRIQAQDAWDVTTGNSNIVVAVVDDAVNTNHYDLVGKCVTGRDVADNDSDPNPPNYDFIHGTHVAGIVGASTNNGSGVASIGYNVSIMPIKSISDGGTAGVLTHAYEGVEWAANNNADIINMSWGRTSPPPTNTEETIINNASSQGVILVGAAGRDGTTDIVYPASMNNVICVAGTNINDNKISASHYGPWIDISAPGGSILSTFHHPSYSLAIFSGTSMAAPFVSGLCGLILSVNPNLSPSEVENCMLSTADPLSNSDLGAGRINAFEAVQCAENQSGSGLDIFLTQVSVSNTNLSEGDAVTISCFQNVANATVGILNPYPDVKFYVSDDMVVDGSDKYLGYEFSTIGTSDVNDFEQRNLTVQSSWGCGVRYILLEADANQEYAESDENNNLEFVQIYIDCGNGPDLIIEEATSSKTTTCPYEYVYTTTKVKNIGDYTSTINTRLKYYLSTNDTYEANVDIYLQRDYVDDLAPNEVGNEKAWLRSPANTSPGEYYILFVADETDICAESNENNNVGAIPLTIVSCKQANADGSDNKRLGGLNFKASPSKFNTYTQLSYTLDEDSPVTITIFDMTGKKVEQLLNEKMQEAGPQTIQFKASDNMSNGLYLCQINTGKVQKSIKILLDQ